VLATTDTARAQALDYQSKAQPIETAPGEVRVTVAAPVYITLPAGVDFRFTAVSGASFAAGPQAADSIVSGFGTDLRTEPVETTLPLTFVTVIDSLGVQRRGVVFYAGPNQVNFLIPPATARGAARVVIGRGDSVVASANVEIVPVAPGLFSANGDGAGVAAAAATRIRADGSQNVEPVAQLSGERFVAAPVPAAAAGEQLYLTLYGTGLRAGGQFRVTVGGVEAQVAYAGAQGDFAGLDQVNVAVPQGVRGEVPIVITVDGVPSNAVTASIQ
jgi:uncharacterized protein (TIGR03437 family)